MKKWQLFFAIFFCAWLGIAHADVHAKTAVVHHDVAPAAIQQWKTTYAYTEISRALNGIRYAIGVGREIRDTDWSWGQSLELFGVDGPIAFMWLDDAQMVRKGLVVDGTLAVGDFIEFTEITDEGVKAPRKRIRVTLHDDNENVVATRDFPIFAVPLPDSSCIPVQSAGVQGIPWIVSGKTAGRIVYWHCTNGIQQIVTFYSSFFPVLQVWKMKDSDEKYAAGLFDEKRLAAPITDFGLFTFGNYETMSPFLLRMVIENQNAKKEVFTREIPLSNDK